MENKSQYYIAGKQGNTETIIYSSYVVEMLDKESGKYNKVVLYPEYPTLKIAKEKAKWYKNKFHTQTRIVKKKITSVTTIENCIIEYV